MNARTFAVAAALLVVGLPVLATPAAAIPEPPPVCGDFYDWCGGLVDRTVRKYVDVLCHRAPATCPFT